MPLRARSQAPVLNAFAPLVLWRSVERPLDQKNWFGRESPLEVEIGFGSGDYLVQCALARPDHDFVGIEIPWPSVKRALGKLRNAKITNARILQVEAHTALERMFRPRSVSRMVALFPCPWPKKRHAKHRLFSTDFLRLVNSRLEDEGEFQIVTDAEPFSAWILEQSENTGFEVTHQPVTAGYGTKYEKKWLAGGQAIFHELLFKKQRHEDIHVKEDAPVRAQKLTSFDPETFRPKGLHEAGIHIQFKEFLYDPIRLKGMVQTVVAEQHLEQVFWIEIANQEDCWRIQPARGCGIIPSAAIQTSVDLVRDAAASTSDL